MSRSATADFKAATVDINGTTFRSPMMPLQGYLHDTQGELMIDGRPHPCVILGLTVDQLTLSLTADLADYIPQARLNIDRMRLLLSGQAIGNDPSPPSGLPHQSGREMLSADRSPHHHRSRVDAGP